MSGYCATLSPRNLAYTPTYIPAMGDEAKTVERKAETISAKLVSGTFSTALLNNKLNRMVSCFNTSTVYASVLYLAHATEQSPEEAEMLLRQNPHIFQISLLKSSSGQAVYFRKKPFGRLVDLVNTYRHLYYMKFQA